MKIILLPGLDGTGILYDDLIAALHGEYECVTLKYPAHELLSYNELEVLIRSQLPKSEPFTILAESFSGPLGISIAAHPPSNLKGLILCCTFARQPVSPFFPARFLLKVIPLALIPKWLMCRVIIGNFRTKENEGLLNRALAEVQSNIIKDRMRSVLKINVLNKLALVGAPILYLQATKDKVVREKSAEEIKAVLNSVEITSIHAPHFLLQVKPLEAANAVRGFISKILLHSR